MLVLIKNFSLGAAGTLGSDFFVAGLNHIKKYFFVFHDIPHLDKLKNNQLEQTSELTIRDKKNTNMFVNYFL